MGPAEAYAANRLVSFDYVNWKGVRSLRTVFPLRIEWQPGNAWHPDPQWFLVAIDVNKDEERTFAIKDITNWTPFQETKT